MAKAKLKPVPPMIKLTISVEEASALLSVLNKVGGEPDTTPRGKCDDIAEALHGVGAKPVDWEIGEGLDSVYFKNP